MRLDKYLKTARILKRRTISKELAAHQRVTINGRIAKPASDVQPGDVIEITFGERRLQVKVLGVKEIVRKNEADALYEVLSESIVSDASETENEEKTISDKENRV